MTALPGFFDKDRNIQLLLFLCSFLLVFLGMKDLFLHANAVLISPDGDAIKNYYTFIYHTAADTGMLEFSGSNHPYGEHIVYTDGQPLLSWIFRFLPFTHPYLVGTLHLLILFSYIITPCIYYKIFRLFNLNGLVAFCSSLAIVMLSPQLARMSGHFGLSYACLIPLLILCLVKYSLHPSRSLLIRMLLFNTLVFFIHPYFGLGFCLLCLAYFFVAALLERTGWKRSILPFVVTGLLPILLFKLFMFLTDHHTGRSDNVYGADVYVSNPASVFVSHFGGPFEHLMKQVVKVGHREWEGLAYIGFFMDILIVGVAVLSIIYFRRYKFNRIVLALLLCSLLLLLVAFGLPVKIAKAFHIEANFLSKFRSTGRYAWFFYYIVPVFLIVSLDKFFRELYARQVLRWMIPLSIGFLILNLVEGKSYFKKTFTGAFAARNIFRSELLDDTEKKLVAQAKDMKAQAILPVPFYHVGSEVLERYTPEPVYISMLLSWHCRLPIIGAQLARTSVWETKEQLGLLNEYADHVAILAQLNDQPIAVIQAAAAKFPDESRLMERATLKLAADNYKLFSITKNKFDFEKSDIAEKYLQLKTEANRIDTAGITYIRMESRKPFLPTNQKEYAHLFSIEKGQHQPGNYILSLHYHFRDFTPRYIDCGLIISESTGGIPMNSRTMMPYGHVYDSFIVLERDLVLKPETRYDFILSGGSAEEYHVSDLLLRPDTVDVLLREHADQKKVSVNGHPFLLK